jgi:alkanesulfonate monooxygenase SsuD/methylene tetrahydromethanopterin reductase-like flavin-dependent oxidoreductase (luciferase family)
LKPEIKFGVNLPTVITSSEEGFNELLSYALKAERMGFDLVTTADHVFIPYESLSLLTAIAMKTRRIKLGTTVIDSNRRSPAVLAHITATLDRISGGRFILGMGRGVWNEASYGFEIKKPIKRMREIIIILKKFWTEDKVNYSGSFFKFKDASIAGKPVQKPHPPIWIAGFGPEMLKMAGELGDGFITQNISPELYERDLEFVRNSAKRSGRDPQKITSVFCAPMSVASCYEDALKDVEKTIRGSLFRHGGPPWNWASFFGYEKPWERPEDIPLEIVDKCGIFGTPDDCIEKIEKYISKGVSWFISQGLSQPNLQFFAEKVITYFRDNQ